MTGVWQQTKEGRRERGGGRSSLPEHTQCPEHTQAPLTRQPAATLGAWLSFTLPHSSESDSCLLNEKKHLQGVMSPSARASSSWHTVWEEDMHFDPRPKGQPVKE